MAYTRKLTNGQRTIICQRYVAGESSCSLAHHFSVSPPAIRSLLRRQGIARRPQSEAQRLFQCDHSFFSTIDNEQKAYWLGFMAADGYISRNALVIALAQTDKEHLQRFQEAIHATHPIHDYKYPNTSFSRLFIRSSQLVDGLANYGVVPNKTFIFRWPILHKDLQTHFIRGYIDGDGGFYARRTAYPTPAISFEVTGNEPFLLSLQAFLMEQCSLRATKLYRRHKDIPIATLRYVGRKQVSRIFALLYRDATIYLPRKHDIVAASL